MSHMAKFLRAYNRRSGLCTSLESANGNQVDVNIDRDIEVIADVIDPEVNHTQSKITHASWVDSSHDDTVAEPLQAALDEYSIEDDIQELENINMANYAKMEQLQELKQTIAANWNDSVTADDVAKLNVADESKLIAYRGRKLPLSVAMEAIDIKSAGLAAAGVATLIAIIWKIFTLIRARFGKGANSDAAKKVADENIDEADKNISSTLNSSSYNPNKVIKTEDIETIFGELDAGTSPDSLIQKYKNMETITVKEFVEEYLNEVILTNHTGNAQKLALKNPSGMSTYVKKLTEFGNKLPKILEAGKEIAEALNTSANGGKLSTSVSTKHEKTIKEVRGYIVQLDNINTALNNQANADMPKLNHNTFVKAVKGFDKIASLPDETENNLNEFVSEQETLNKNEALTNNSDPEVKKAVAPMLAAIKDIGTFFAKYQSTVNTIASARLAMSKDYLSYSKAMAKAYKVEKPKK